MPVFAGSYRFFGGGEMGGAEKGYAPSPVGASSLWSAVGRNGLNSTHRSMSVLMDYRSYILILKLTYFGNCRFALPLALF